MTKSADIRPFFTAVFVRKYCSAVLLQVVVGNMLEEVKNATLPIVHHEVDAWTCKVSGRKYLGFHVHYVNSDLELKNALLSVSEGMLERV